MKPLRIALVASSYAPYIGGVEQHTAHVAGQLRDRGHAVEIWTVARDGHAGTREVAHTTVRDLPTPLPARSVGALGRFVLASPAAWFAWLSAWVAFRPDILHVQCFGPNGPYAHAISSLTRTPLMVSSHGETDADDNDIFRTSLLIPAALRRAVKAARSVTGCSASVVKDLQHSFGAREVAVVPNGVEAVDLETLERVPGRVVAAGRLEYNKGFDLLIRAIAEVQDCHLVLVGDGRQRRELHTLCDRLGVVDRVQFRGPLSPMETRRAMAIAAVVVVPSRKESFGLVALEAWSAGIPLVATSLGGPRDFVTDGMDGLLVDPEDTSALAEAIRSVLTDPELAQRMVDAGTVSAQNYTWESVAVRYESLYREIV